MATRAWTCSTNILWIKEVPGSSEPHRVRYGPIPSDGPHGFVRGYTCTCRGFQYRGECSHIKKVRSTRCGWNAACEPGLLPLHRKCPECGGPVNLIEA